MLPQEIVNRPRSRQTVRFAEDALVAARAETRVAAIERRAGSPAGGID